MPVHLRSRRTLQGGGALRDRGRRETGKVPGALHPRQCRDRQ